MTSKKAEEEIDAGSFEFQQYHKIKRIGDEETEDIFTNPKDDIVIEEKIDGANFRFYISNIGKLIFGSRTQQLTSNEGEDINVSKNFIRCLNHIRGQLGDKDLTKYKGFIFYGECCVRHTMAYDWVKIPPYLGFDIKILQGDDHEYLNYKKKKKIFKALTLEMVPLIGIVKAKDIKEITEEMVPISAYPSPSSKDTQAEGIVFKNYKKQIFGKYVRDAFKEKSAETFGGTPKYNRVGDTNNADFLFKYVTNPRIEKLIFKKIDEDKKLNMTLMGELIRDTYTDIIEEEWREILTSNWKLDFKGVRKLIAPRVRAVLEQVITNNALEDKKC